MKMPYCIAVGCSNNSFKKNREKQGVIQKIFLGGGSTKKCDHDCVQPLIKSSWGSV